MSTSYPVTLPTTPSLRSVVFRTVNTVGMNASPFTLQAQTYVWNAGLLVADCSLPPMKRANAETWLGCLVSLRGREGSFLLGDRANLSPRGTATGTPLVNGASQTGSALATDGWTAGVTGIMKAGDWLQLGTGSTSRLYKVLADVNSNGSGQATLELWPSLRSSPADNAAITVSSPKGLFMLGSDIEWNINEAKVYGINFTAVEDTRA